MRLPATTPLPLAPSTAPTHARIEQAAHGLEQQFAQMLIKSMRDASMGDPLLGENTTYRDMYDQQLAKTLTQGRGLGLAPAIVRQLVKSTAPAQATPATLGPLPLQRAPAAPLPLATPPSSLLLQTSLHGGNLALAPSSHGVSLPAVTPPAAPAPTAACDPDTRVDCSSPEAFVRSLWPHAQKTAAALGVPAKALVAQAALETNWGKRLAGDSHNLFGIKAGAQWLGQKVSAATHEFVGGVRVAQQAAFRAYGSASDAFADYAQLLSGPRYAAARGTGEDTRRFAQALQHAGYATDPAYAAKIAAIANGPTLNHALARLDGMGGAIASIDTPARTEG